MIHPSIPWQAKRLQFMLGPTIVRLIVIPEDVSIVGPLENNHGNSIDYSFILAWAFITLQIKEFRNLAFYINDSIFGSMFFFPRNNSSGHECTINQT